MNLTAVRADLIAALATITGLTVSGRPPAPIAPPHIWISDTALEQTDTSGGITYTFTLTCIVSGSSTPDAYASIDTTLAAVDSALNRDLASGTIDTVRYRNIGQLVTDTNIIYPGFLVDVEVIG